MEGEVYLTINIEEYEKRKEQAILDHANDNGIDGILTKAGFSFTNIKADILEISDQSIGISFETPIGYVSIYMKPTRDFLANISKIAVERVNKAVAILEKGIAN